MKTEFQTSEIERFRKIQKRKNLRQTISLVTVILLIIILTMIAIIKVLNNYKPSPQFMFLAERSISDKYQVNALLIRDETVFRSPAEGKVRSLFADGSKVAKNEKLAYIISQSQSAELKELRSLENEIINYQYELIEKDNNVGARQIDQETTGQIRKGFSNVYNEILSKSFYNLATDESTLNAILSQRNDKLRNYDFKDSRLNELLDHYHDLEEKLGGKSNLVESSQSGVYIRSYDGLEDRLNPSNVKSLTADQVNEYLQEAKQGRLDTIEEVKKNDPMYCLTNSIEQLFAFFIPAGKSTEVQVNSSVDAVTSDGINLRHGLVIRSEESNQGTFLVVRCNTGLERLADRRIVELHLELNKQKGLRIPATALVDYKKGNSEAKVYLEEGGKIAEATVKITAMTEDYALIEGVGASKDKIVESAMLVLNPNDVSLGDSASGLE